MLLKKRKIAAVIVAVVMIFTTVNFLPYGTCIAEASEQEHLADEMPDEATMSDASNGSIQEAECEETIAEALEQEQIGENIEQKNEEQNEEAAEEQEIFSEEIPLAGSGAWSVTDYSAINYSQSYGHSFTVSDGASSYSAYCCNKENSNTPITGTSGGITDITNDAYRRVFFYGCLHSPSEYTSYSFNSEAHRVLAVSQTLSKYYSGTGNVFDTFEAAIASLSVPDASISITEPEAKAKTEGNIQKTGNYTVNADGHTSVSVSIPQNVTLHYGGNEYTNTVTLTDRAQFYLTAPLSVTGSVTGTATGEQTVSRVYLLDFRNGIQPLMFADYISPSASYTASFEALGGIEIQKSSANPAVTDGSSCYSLQGAVYKIYKSRADANTGINAVATIKTNAFGYGKADNLAFGTYYLKEMVAPKGYALDATVYMATINSSTAVKLSVTDMPQMDPVSVLLTKKDDTGTGLEGAEYTIKYYREYMDDDPAIYGNYAEREWVVKTDEDGYSRLSDKYKVSGDTFYYGPTGNPQLPLGTITIQETKAPEGYLLDNTVHVRQITSSGTAEAVNSYNAPTITEHIIRSDLAFTKKDAVTGETISNVKFSITDESGETHIVWTDENGYYSTSASYIPHSKDTNSDAAGAGIWFGSTAVDDSLGALPYGTYTVQELRCDANKNKYKALDAFTVTITEHGTVVDIGDIYNESFPTLQTSVRDSLTGTNVAAYKDTITAIDTVQLKNLEVGHRYTIRGKVMCREDAVELLNNGKVVTAERTFIATESVMSVEVLYTFEAKELTGSGTDIVFYEYLYDEAYPDELIASHEDITDENQTLHFPSIHTTAKDSVTNTHKAMRSKISTIVDTVSYEGIEPGKEYVLQGIVYDKDTGKPLEIDGETFTATLAFVPETETGSVDMSYTFNSLYLNGKSVVIYEYLYMDDVLIAVHADINDEGQTVTFDNYVGTIVLDLVTGPGGGQFYHLTPHTGDNAPIMWLFGIMAASAAGMLYLWFGARNKRRKSALDKKRITVLMVAVTVLAGVFNMCKTLYADSIFETDSDKADSSGKLYEYVLTTTGTCNTDDESTYDFGFQDTLDVDDEAYSLDHIEYSVVNAYESAYGSKEIAYEMTETEVVTDEEKQGFVPDKKQIECDGYTYYYADTGFKQADEAEIISVSKYVDSDITTGIFAASDYPDEIEYVHENGMTYQLAYTGYDIINEGWHSGYLIKGRVINYDAATYQIGDVVFSRDDFTGLDENALAVLVNNCGYPTNIYKGITAAYTSEPYMDSEGRPCRDYAVACEVYGRQYRVYYGAELEIPMYEATLTYTLADEEKEYLEELKTSYIVTARAFYNKAVKEKEGLSVPAKLAIGSGIILLIILFASLLIYLVKGGRKPTDYKSKRDARRDYKNL